MSGKTIQQSRQYFLVTLFVLISLPIFASGHLPDLGLVVEMFALLALFTWGTGLLALIFALLYRRKQSRGLQVAAYVFALQSLMLELYLGGTVLLQTSSNYDTVDFKSMESYAIIIPLIVSLLSILLLLVSEPNKPVELNNSGEAEDQQHTEVNTAPAKWINTFRLFVFIYYSYVIVQTLVSFVAMLSNRFTFTLSQNSGDHIGYLLNAILLTVQLFFSFSHLIYVPAIFYFLIKRSKWCWVLLFADSVLAGITLVLSQWKYLFRHPQMVGTHIILLLVLVFFIWLDEVGVYLNISKQQKMKYVKPISIAALVLVAVKISAQLMS